MELQELLEAARHRVLWSPALADGPGAVAQGETVDVVVLVEREGQPYGPRLEAWRELDPPPGVLAVVTSADGRSACDRDRIPFVVSSAPPGEMAAAVDRALRLRWAGRLAPSYARGALRVPASDDPVMDAANIVSAARQADLELVREALRWYALYYVTATPLVAALRERRALQIPEVEITDLCDGARTAQTVVRQSRAGGAAAGRLLWALACTGGVTLTPEPPDLATEQRRAVAMTRKHLRARRAHMELTTYYDVLEVTPRADHIELDTARHMLAVRFSPERLAQLDLGDLAEQVVPLWQVIEKAYQTLRDPAERLRYNEALGRRQGGRESAWAFGPNDRIKADEAYGRGQKALLDGEPFKAVSALATAARTHADHPDYEASLCWARYRAELARGKSREEIGSHERTTAEEHQLGRRPWPRGLLAVALLCAADGDPATAQWYLREALACDPNLPAAKQLLSRLGKRAPTGAE